MALIGSTPLPKLLAAKLEAKLPAALWTVLRVGLLTALLVICTAYLTDGSFNPFLYFRF